MLRVSTQQKTIDRRRRELTDFVNENGRLPHTRAEDAKEMGLAYWAHRHLKSECPDPEVVHLVEAHGGYRRDRTMRTVERVAELERFVDDHNRLPLASAGNKDEVSLAQWLAAHRGRRTAQPAVLEILARFGQAPQVRVASTEDRLNQLRAFLGEHGRRPKLTRTRAEESSLARWVATSLRDPDSAPRVRELLEPYGVPVIRRRAKTPVKDARVQQLRQFVDTHGRGPRHGAHGAEASLYQWLHRPSRAREPEQEVLEILAELGHPSAHARRVIQLEQFIAAHRRLPRSTGPEADLYAWMSLHVRRLGADPKVVELVDQYRPIKSSSAALR